MARIVLGIGTSHTPLLVTPAEDWKHRAAADYANAELTLSDGRTLTYEELRAEVGDRYEDEVSLEAFRAKSERCQAALDRLADALAASAPDVVIIIGDDQEELFDARNQPAFAVFYGEEVVTSPSFGAETAPAWLRGAAPNYLMDRSHVIQGAPALARELIDGLLDRHVDVAVAAKVDDPERAAFGHAFGFVVKRLFRGRRMPVIPVLLNTYYPPNVPRAARCHDIGKAIGEALAASPTDLRVAIVASGGLSHFVVDQHLDRQVIEGCAPERGDILRNLPMAALRAGSSEILNWVMLAGAMGATPLKWCEYVPIQRTPAGTGIGAGFAVWGDPEAGEDAL